VDTGIVYGRTSYKFTNSFGRQVINNIWEGCTDPIFSVEKTAARAPETLLIVYQITWRHIPEDRCVNIHLPENPKSDIEAMNH
jgi:hypothetical protein